MDNCAHILAPSKAWAPTRSPKLTRRRPSKVGNAIRAMKPRFGKAKTEDLSVCVLNEDLLSELEDEDREKRRSFSSDASTQSPDSGTSSSSASVAEEVSLPGSVTPSSEEISTPSTLSDPCPLSCDEEECDLEVTSIACNHRKTELPHLANELHQMAILISQRAASKYSGRVYQDVRNAFLVIDADGDGKICLAEARAFCKHFDLTPEIATRFFSLLDPHQSGLGDWSAFLAKCAPVFRGKSNWRLAPPVGRKQPALK